MRRLLRSVLLGLCLWLPAAHASATMAAGATPTASVPSPAVEVDAALRELELGPQLEVFEDASGAMNLQAVQAAGGFRPVPADGLKIGFSKSAWWIRVTLHNTQPRDRQLVLREAYPLMDSIELWSPQRDGRWTPARTGDRLPFGSREYAHRDFLFDLDLPASGTQSYYLRFASSGPIDIALSLYEPRALVGVLSEEQLAYGAYFGGFLVLVLYNFFIFLVVRDRAFFWYLLYAISYGLYFSVFNGLSFQFLWPGNPAWANQSLLVLLSFTLVFGLQFTRRFLDTRTTAPRLDRVALALQVLGLAALAASPFLPYALLIQPLALLTVLVTVMIIVLGTHGLVKGYKPARYFMIAWGLLLLGVVMTMLKNYGLLPHNLITQNGFQVGSLCEMVLLSLALAARVSEMQRQSRTDALTKVYNRRFFDERVNFEFERAQRVHQPVSLLVVDIDHFKQFNDRFGHARGDEVLKSVARALLDGVRSQDTVCRYGGEEFALILPGIDAIRAVAVAETLRRSIEQGTGEPGKAPLAGPVTISVGVASTEDGGISGVAELFRAADTALYEAKAAGRNRVVHFRGSAAVGGAAVPGTESSAEAASNSNAASPTSISP